MNLEGEGENLCDNLPLLHSDIISSTTSTRYLLGKEHNLIHFLERHLSESCPKREGGAAAYQAESLHPAHFQRSSRL
jgi:hypothetical protein